MTQSVATAGRRADDRATAPDAGAKGLRRFGPKPKGRTASVRFISEIARPPGVDPGRKGVG